MLKLCFAFPILVLKLVVLGVVVVVLVEVALIDHVGSEHFRELVVLEATSQEFLFGQVAVAVLIHAGEDILGSFLNWGKRNYYICQNKIGDE